MSLTQSCFSARFAGTGLRSFFKKVVDWFASVHTALLRRECADIQRPVGPGIDDVGVCGNDERAAGNDGCSDLKGIRHLQALVRPNADGLGKNVTSDINENHATVLKEGVEFPNSVLVAKADGLDHAFGVSHGRRDNNSPRGAFDLLNEINDGGTNTGRTFDPSEEEPHIKANDQSPVCQHE